MNIPRATLEPLLAASFLPVALCLAWAAGPAPLSVLAAPGSDAASAPNSDPIYQQLRHLGLGSEALSIHEVVLKRDAGTFTFHSGTVCFAAPVAGKISGAVFKGDGSFTLVPPTPSERRSLSLLTLQPAMEEQYSELALRFTDDTYKELKAAPGAKPRSGRVLPRRHPPGFAAGHPAEPQLQPRSAHPPGSARTAARRPVRCLH